MEKLTYKDLAEEAESIYSDIVGFALGETEGMSPDQLRDTLYESLHDAVEGHQWVIYYHQAFLLYSAARQRGGSMYDDAEELMMQSVKEEATLDDMFAAFAYYYLQNMIQAAFDDNTEEIGDYLRVDLNTGKSNEAIYHVYEDETVERHL